MPNTARRSRPCPEGEPELRRLHVSSPRPQRRGRPCRPGCRADGRAAPRRDPRDVRSTGHGVGRRVRGRGTARLGTLAHGRHGGERLDPDGGTSGAGRAGRWWCARIRREPREGDPQRAPGAAHLSRDHRGRDHEAALRALDGPDRARRHPRAAAADEQGRESRAEPAARRSVRGRRPVQRFLHAVRFDPGGARAQHRSRDVRLLPPRTVCRTGQPGRVAGGIRCATSHGVRRGTDRLALHADRYL